MKNSVFHPTAMLILSCLLLSGCSGGKDQDQAKPVKKTSTEQAADSIKDYSRNAMGKARAAQQQGEERTMAIDDALRRK